jgi:arginine-tRNA-protein transferase
MAYKASFRPMERLGREGWQRMDQVELAEPPSIGDQLPTRSPRRILVDA